MRSVTPPLFPPSVASFLAEAESLFGTHSTGHVADLLAARAASLHIATEAGRRAR